MSERWTMALLNNPEELIAKIVEAGQRYADLKAAATALEETKGSVLGQLVTTLIMQGKPAGASEHMARANGVYRSHIAQMAEARKQADRAKAFYEAGQAFLDLARTMEATRRQEMRLGG
jgi:hypothetical protein